jgi:hypothetical protein
MPTQKRKLMMSNQHLSVESLYLYARGGQAP